MTKYIIGRPINGISLNGLEYALNSKGELMHFESIEDAKNYLRENGVPIIDIENFYMIVEANDE